MLDSLIFVLVLLVPVGILAASGALVWKTQSDPKERRRFLFVLGGAVLFALGGLLLLGIPGALIYEAALPVVRLILGSDHVDASRRAMNAGIWAVAIYFNILWPVSVVFAYALAFGPLRATSRWVRVLVLLVVPYAAAVVMGVIAHG